MGERFTNCCHIAASLIDAKDSMAILSKRGKQLLNVHGPNKILPNNARSASHSTANPTERLNSPSHVIPSHGEQ
jgi:hypothetical protein